MKNRIVLIFSVLIVALAVTVWALRPAPAGVEVAVADEAEVGQPVEVDITRLMHTVEVLAHDSMQGRAPGTPESEQARAFLIGSLSDAGVEPYEGSFEHPFTFVDDRPGINVVGILRGQTEQAIVLTAHYDHVGVRDGVVYNGADDNASGTAAVLEVARVLAQEPLDHTLILALFDAEEVGLQGARAFVGRPTVPLDQIALNVNLDMVSRSGGTLWAAGAYHTPALRPVLEAVAERAPTELRLGHDSPEAGAGQDWTTASDHGPFHGAGIPFVYFGVEDHPDYHQPTDDSERIVPEEFETSVATILAALRALDAALPLEPNS